MRLFPLWPATTLHAIANRLGWTALPLDKIHERVIWDYRLSRALVASLCGAGLALCGAILQPLLRNPLAEPDVPGISAGASTGAVSVIVPGIGAGAVTLSGGALRARWRPFCSWSFWPAGRAVARIARSWQAWPPRSLSTALV